MPRTPPLLLPLDWTDTFGPGAQAPAGDEGPIFLTGLDDLLARLEARPDHRPPDSGDTLESLADLLADAGLTR